MGRALRRCNLTVTQNNNSIKRRIMAKASVKNLVFLNQDQEIRTVSPKQRLKGRAGVQQGARYHCPWGIPATMESQLWDVDAERTRGPWCHLSQLNTLAAPRPQSPGEGKAPLCMRKMTFHIHQGRSWGCEPTAGTGHGGSQAPGLHLAWLLQRGWSQARCCCLSRYENKPLGCLMVLERGKGSRGAVLHETVPAQPPGVCSPGAHSKDSAAAAQRELPSPWGQLW